MSSPTPLLVTIGFQVPRHGQAVWRAVWSDVVRAASRSPRCHFACLIQDHEDPCQCSVMSVWEDRASFNQFVRRSGLLWIHEAVGCSEQSPEFIFSDVIPHASVEPVDAAMAVEALLAV